MTKAAFTQAVRPRSNLLLPGLLLLAALFYALTQYLVSDPGADGGSGIGGTGMLGGESGFGGTGGPIKLGALDMNDDEERQEFLAGLPGRTTSTATPHIDVVSLNLTPVKPAVTAASTRPSPRVPASAGDALRASLVAVDEAARARVDEQLQTLKKVEIDLGGERGELDAEVRRHIAESFDSAARLGIREESSALTQDLILAQAALEVSTDVSAPLIIDVVGGEDERRRPAVPVRPERPDRPSVPAQRFTPPQRAVPTPPVRPLRL